MFHIISPFLFFLDCVLLSFPHHLKLNKNFFIETADTEVYSTHPFETSPPPPPPPGCLEVARLLNSRSQRTLSRQPGGGGGGGLISKGCARPHSRPVPIAFPLPLHSRQAGSGSNTHTIDHLLGTFAYLPVTIGSLLFTHLNRQKCFLSAGFNSTKYFSNSIF